MRTYATKTARPAEDFQLWCGPTAAPQQMRQLATSSAMHEIRRMMDEEKTRRAGSATTLCIVKRSAAKVVAIAYAR